MASTFKNAGMAIPFVDDSNADLYSAGGSGQAVIHALYITNKSTANNGFVDVKVTTDGGSTFYHVAKKIQIPASNTLTLDKPINLEASDKLRVIAHALPDSSTADLEVYASILEIS
ncbi:hypothetical protein CMO86_03470 [Candidatus Woesearchaeota archaeon]|nr:hypothetical protein [Candidatus Woesearchaeota archaeon]